jgi:prepilin-type N-terminal cleavage/methylation domain-containing protein
MIKQTKNFTLIELLVVVSILAILMSLIAPSLRRVIYTTRNTACMANFKQMGIGFIQYADDNYDMYPQLGAARASPWEVQAVSRGVLHRDTQGPMEPYNDGLGMKAPNGNFMCPQAVADLHPGTDPNRMTYYGFFFQNMSALGNRGIANGTWRTLPCLENTNGCTSICLAPTIGGWTDGSNVAAPLNLMMRRLGDSWLFKTAMTGRYNRGGVKDLNYNVVATDFSLHGYGIETNHVWQPNEYVTEYGGPNPRMTKQTGGFSRNQSSTSESIINLLMDDGSVQTRKLWWEQVRLGGEDGWNFRSSGGAGRDQWYMPLNLGTPL